MKSRLADFSLRCFTQPVHAPARAAQTLSRSYIASVKPGYPAKVIFEPFATRARNEAWSYYELPTGHDAQAEMPEAFSKLLIEISAASTGN